MFSDQSNNEQQKFWENYLGYLKTLTDKKIGKEYAKPDSKWLLPLLPRQQASDPIEEENVLPGRIQQLLDDELQEHVVSTCTYLFKFSLCSKSIRTVGTFINILLIYQ